MDQVLRNLLVVQKKYIELRKQNDKLIAKLNEIFEFIRNTTDLNNKLNFEKVLSKKNEIDFIFLGVNIFIQTKFDSDKGIIYWGVKTNDENIEKRKTLLIEHFDDLGNVIPDNKNISASSISRYDEKFYLNLLESLNKYFSEDKEVDFYYDSNKI